MVFKVDNVSLTELTNAQIECEFETAKPGDFKHEQVTD